MLFKSEYLRLVSGVLVARMEVVCGLSVSLTVLRGSIEPLTTATRTSNTRQVFLASKVDMLAHFVERFDGIFFSYFGELVLNKSDERTLAACTRWFHEADEISRLTYSRILK